MKLAEDPDTRDGLDPAPAGVVDSKQGALRSPAPAVVVDSRQDLSQGSESEASSSTRRRWLPALFLLGAVTYVWPITLAFVGAAICLAIFLAQTISLFRLSRAQEVLEPSIEERGRRCPFCHEDFAAGQIVESCACCQTVHHADCREEFGACATFACEAPSEPGRRFAIAADLVTGWEHPDAVEIDGAVATPFPDGTNYDRVTGLRRLRLEDYAC